MFVKLSRTSGSSILVLLRGVEVVEGNDASKPGWDPLQPKRGVMPVVVRIISAETDL
jgi:hypothetical protein